MSIIFKSCSVCGEVTLQKWIRHNPYIQFIGDFTGHKWHKMMKSSEKEGKTKKERLTMALKYQTEALGLG